MELRVPALPGTRIAPGGWSQVAAELTGPKGRVLAVDILDMQPVAGVEFIQGDFREDAVATEVAQALGGRSADLVVSDMAPNLSGVAASDSARIAHLVELAVAFALEHLTPQGALVCKVFHGSGYSQLMKLFKDSFRTAKAFKPKASRDKSAETFLVGVGPKPRQL